MLLHFPPSAVAVAVAVRRICVRFCVLCVICAAVIAGRTLNAQGPTTIVKGDVLQPDGATRASGVLVVATDTTSAEVARSLSGSEGEYSLTLPGAGRYVLRALRVGFRPTLMPEFTIAAGETRTVAVILTGEAVRLDAVTVSAKSSCQINHDSGQVVARLWEQALTVLGASTVSAGGRTHNSTLVRIKQSSEKNDRIVRAESISVFEQKGGEGFRSVSPELLAAYGYVVENANRIEYHAPDANAFLSPYFATSHCFDVQASRTETKWIGLGFRPSVTRENVADIQGVLWLDRESAELRRLEFKYVNMPRRSGYGEADGWVQFVRLPTGDWIVTRWAIGSPIVEYGEQRGVMHFGVNGRTTVGGITQSVEQDGKTIFTDRGPTLSITFTTRDSPGGAAGVNAEIVGTKRVLAARADGIVEFSSLLPGKYIVRASTPFARWIGSPAVEREFEVTQGERRMETFELPGDQSIANTVCARSNGRGLRVLYGNLVDENGRAVPSANVTLEWSATGDVSSGVVIPKLTAKAGYTDSLGRWRTCLAGPVHGDAVVTVDGRDPVRLPLNSSSTGPQRIDLRLPPPIKKP